MENYVRYQVNNGIGVIEFFTAQHNSLPSAILKELANTVTIAGGDASCKVLILQSGGAKTFCAGASFDELLQITTEAEGLEFFSGFAHVINAMRTCPKFIIGRVQGKAIGGGVGLASSCDYTFGTLDASIKLSELAVGIGPFVVGPAVERKIGLSAAYELAIDATGFRSAQWAQEKGLYASVHSDITSMDAAILNLATTLAASSPAAMAEIKAAFWSGTEHWNELLLSRAAISGRLILTAEARVFLEGFKKK
ncbi:MAG: enoyl-CoA hydratase [Chitinophagaceae bacterium BSSC1]|nr:MAG: enoyl-CoA hydratase [Chitinophagaceae bacterium BSSC1]